MNGTMLVSVIATLAMLYLVAHGLSAQRLPRGTAIRMALLWFGLFGLVVLLVWILTNYGQINLT